MHKSIYPSVIIFITFYIDIVSKIKNKKNIYRYMVIISYLNSKTLIRNYDFHRLNVTKANYTVAFNLKKLKIINTERIYVLTF